jgi:hypothetical protein
MPSHQWEEIMRRLIVVALVLGLAGLASTVRADDLTGSDRILCTAVQVTACRDSGDCVVDLPWNLNVPQFIEVDLKAKRLATTKASGENRATPIDTLRRENGTIVLQGFEKGRAFSIVVIEQTGQMSAAVAAEGKAVGVFGACTPITSG